MQGVTDHYTLFASIPIIDPPLGTEWKIDLIDNPGFGEAKEGVSDLATTAVTSSSSYVYIMNYKQLGDDEDTKAFRLMAAKDKGKLGSELVTCTFCLTHAYHQVGSLELKGKG